MLDFCDPRELELLLPSETQLSTLVAEVDPVCGIDIIGTSYFAYETHVSERRTAGNRTSSKKEGRPSSKFFEKG
jgi:hypothetical protein